MPESGPTTKKRVLSIALFFWSLYCRLKTTTGENMNEVKQIEDRRNALLEEMRSIRSMRRGTINEQYFKTYSKGKKEMKRQGPYYVFSRREGGKTVSQRMNSPAELEQARREVEEYKKFLLLCREFEQLTTRMGELERAHREIEREKKRPRSPLSKTRK